ncbi:MAG: arabinosyltransferase domain-containing protein [Corynebacterium sp.]|nr:arabinosyltransferase domain-containing protein [Corynebacterium sp.]
MKLRQVAIISGLVGFILFLLTPFLPVNQTQSSVDWPEAETTSVTVPLMSYAPQTLTATIPIAAAEKLNPDQTVMFSTLPESAPKAVERGLFIRKNADGIDAVSRNEAFFFISNEDLATLPAGATLELSSTSEETTITVGERSGTVDGDYRPQVTGLYTELAPDTPGVHAHMEINSRFTTAPTVLKYAAMWLGIVCLLISLWALHRLDGPRVPLLPAGFWKLTLLDGIVTAVLVYWYIFGGNTSDDGFIMTMARKSHVADYMANYYRWFGVPESPFGAPYYDLLGLMTYISTSSMWVRLPSLISGLLIWIMLSRSVLPRLGPAVSGRRVTFWTAAFIFLAFWLPYNNGVRPEPIIAMLSLATWVLCERSFATNRLLPGAIAVILATIALAAGPTGLMAVGALLIGVPSLITVIRARIPEVGGVAPLLVPFLPAGFAILMAVFGDQTLMTVIEAIKVRADKGPSLPWYLEWVRYETIMQGNVDGSFTRRFPVFILFVVLAIVIASILRERTLPGTNAGPANRLTLMTMATFFFFMFTPTKWSHHFGVFAGIGAGVAALGALAVSLYALRCLQNKLTVIGGFLFIMAWALAGPNGWWYVSSYSIPWFDKSIQLKGVEASTVVLAIAMVFLVAAVVTGFARAARNTDETTHSSRFDAVFSAPIAVVAALVVVFSCLSFAKSTIDQYPAYSIGLGNLRSLTGNTANLASDVLMETDTNDAFLQPISGELGTSLDGGQNFGAVNIPAWIETSGQDTSTRSQGTIAGNVDNDAEAANGTSAGAATTRGGVRGPDDAGINGSFANLPFGLDWERIPVTGSWRDGVQLSSSLNTQWFALPTTPLEEQPLIVVTAAGRIAGHDINGVKVTGQELLIEYGRRGADGAVEALGEVKPLDIGPSPEWRNLRIPRSSLPAEADVIRIAAKDTNLNSEEWIAFTPPRVPTLAPLSEVIGSEEPGLVDWAVGLQFPQQRPLDHYAGVAEIPTFRISPDHPGKVTLSPFQDYAGGGVMGIAEALGAAVEVPAYLKDDWQRDWGTVERYTLRTNSRGEAPTPATIHYEHVVRSGLWYPGPMIVPTDDE